MNDISNIFNVGDIVADISHPLFFQYRIQGDGKYVPPFMIVKEVFFEDSKKIIFNQATGRQISERIKYTCSYFDDNRSEFVDVHIYEKMLKTFKDIKSEIIQKNGEITRDDKSLELEILGYITSEYQYGKLICFKTKKLEIFKKRTSKKIILESELKVKEAESTIHYVVNYTTPDFILVGYKEENHTDMFYGNGKSRKLTYSKLFKVKWFNPFQNKYSEQYLPAEFFTDFPIFKDTIYKKITDSPS